MGLCERQAEAPAAPLSRPVPVRCPGRQADHGADCGQWTMHAAPGQLHVRAQAPEQDSLRLIQDLLTARLRKLGHREQLTITWHSVLDPEEPRQPS